ncbi:MAG: hypothetical protein ACREXU_20305, partial [Gammaproteobacteria bacterium]
GSRSTSGNGASTRISPLPRDSGNIDTPLELAILIDTSRFPRSSNNHEHQHAPNLQENAQV